MSIDFITVVKNEIKKHIETGHLSDEAFHSYLEYYEKLLNENPDVQTQYANEARRHPFSLVKQET